MPIETSKGGTTFTGRGIDVYRCLAIASALELYARTGMKVNRSYTPKAMMAAAAQITGRTFKTRDYREAAKALRAKATVERLLDAAEIDPGPSQSFSYETPEE
jgi:hypothetical protein